MWRWVTRGLVLTLLALSLASTLTAQELTGQLERPDPSIVQNGMILVQGWILDPRPITKIELYVDEQFQHLLSASLPRIDVVEAYPSYPGIQNSRPGFKTGFLASRFSNGPHTIFLKVFFNDGRSVEFGRRTINIDNTLNQTPFGFIDQPDRAAVYNLSGAHPVVGWAVDTDGIARVEVQIDDGTMQAAMYGDSRPDVASAFPDLPAAMFSGYIANVDTTRIQDGVHELVVIATDRLGSRTEIGRRTVQILNNEANLKPFGYLDEPKRDAVLYGTRCGTVPIISPPQNNQAHITPVRGWALDLGTRRDLGRVSYVELLVDGVDWGYRSDNCRYNPIFGAYTNCYGLIRYDVERYFPNYPDAPRSGFMFTMDVGALIALGVRPGNHVLKVRVGDQQQTFADIPGRDGIPVFFTCAEQDQDFASVGSIDVPVAFDYVGGTVVFQGWAVDENAGVSAVEIVIDGDFVGNAQLNFPRSDVSQQNPHIFNAGNSGWRFTMDTTKLANARHRLTVRVRDGSARTREIGSVDFYVQNSNRP